MGITFLRRVIRSRRGQLFYSFSLHLPFPDKPGTPFLKEQPGNILLRLTPLRIRGNNGTTPHNYPFHGLELHSSAVLRKAWEFTPLKSFAQLRTGV